MAYNPDVPSFDNYGVEDLNKMRENFQILANIATSREDILSLAVEAGDILDSRIVEHNLNILSPSNGYYVRWENGLQICFFRSTSSGTTITWTFPAAFVAVPVVQVSSRRSGGGNPVIMNFTNEPNTTEVTIYKWYWNGSNWANANNEYAHLLAIGRWK